jgi:hypothetical protein
MVSQDKIGSAGGGTHEAKGFIGTSLEILLDYPIRIPPVIDIEGI